jgi:transcriptional regulator with XRE-family HTH domain
MEDAPKTQLARWMAENDKTDEAVAADLNITRSQVNRLRNAVSKPSFDTAAALERLTGIPAGQLFHAAAPADAGDAAA